MITFFLLFLLFSFILAVSEYGWQGAITFTIFAGFIQDPLRKASGIDSSYFAGISLIAFILTFFILKSKFSEWDLELICWPNPLIVSLIPILSYFLLLQGLNSFARFGDIRLTSVGILFYIVPLISLWMGFRTACDMKFLKRILVLYVILCTLTAISILLGLAGVESDLLKEVGTGINITGTGQGFSGLWRTSEIAGWHLAAGSSFAIILGMAESKGLKQFIYFLASIILAFLTISTGRRKALGLVIIFMALYIFYYTVFTRKERTVRAIGIFISVLMIFLGSYGLILNPDIQQTLEPFYNRSTTLTIEESQNRLQVQGIGAIIRGIEIAGPLGYGVGVGTNTGTTDIGSQRQNIISAGYVSEGGGGRLILELGSIGVIFFLFFIVQVLILYFRIFLLTTRFLVPDPDILLGLALFAFANIVTFLSASQLYSDPFILIIIGLTSGAVLVIPKSIIELYFSTKLPNINKT
jgi:hypothetical protein